jgi:putative enterotoxin type A
MRENKKRKLELEEKKMFDDYIRQQNVSLDYFENAAKNLQELNKEIKEENDKYDERQINEMYEYYENGGLVK